MADLEAFVQQARDAGYSGAQIQWHLMKNLGYPPAAAIQATREKMGPPEAPRTIGMPSDTSFSQSMSQVPDQTPGWIQALRDEYNKRFTTTPVMGGPVGSLADITPVIPQSKTEAALLAAGALIPPAKVAAGAKAALRAGTRMLEGAAPEVGALSRGMALAGEAETISPSVAQGILDGSRPIPEGWYVHGRSGGQSLSGNWPIQATKDIDVASGYAGNSGSVWLMREKPNTRVADFASSDSPDMHAFIQNLKKAFAQRSPAIEAVRKNLGERLGIAPKQVKFGQVEEYVRNEFTPSKLVDSAQAFDNADDLNLLEHYPGGWPHLVKTPDGAVVIPGAVDKVDAMNLSGRAMGN